MTAIIHKKIKGFLNIEDVMSLNFSLGPFTIGL